MTRHQWCREHIDEVAEKCDLSKSTVYDVKQAAEFCEQNSDFSECSTASVITLIRVKDEDTRACAISLAQNALNQETPTGGRKYKSLTEKQVKQIIHEADLQVRNDLIKAGKPVPKSDPPKPRPVPTATPDPLPAGTPTVEPVKLYAYVEPVGKSSSAPSRPVQPAVILRPDISPPPDGKVYQIRAGRNTPALISQMIRYGQAEDEENAVMLIFCEGEARYFDRVERIVQKEAEMLAEAGDDDE